MKAKDGKQREGGKASCLVTEAEGDTMRKGEQMRGREGGGRGGGGEELFSKCKELLVTMPHQRLPSLPLRSLRGGRRGVGSRSLHLLCIF